MSERRRLKISPPLVVTQLIKERDRARLVNRVLVGQCAVLESAVEELAAIIDAHIGILSVAEQGRRTRAMERVAERVRQRGTPA